MPLSPPATGSPGGELVMRYENLATADLHHIKLHVCWFDPDPFGVDQDRAYISGGPVVPSETFLSETYAALAALWQPYYTSDWELRLHSVAYNSAGVLTHLRPDPAFATYNGTMGAPPANSWYCNRIFHLLGHTGVRRRLWLQQVPTEVMPSLPFEVTPTSGGLDARDHAWMAYLSGASGGGAVMPDGTYTFDVRDMSVDWAREPRVSAVGVGLPGSPYVVTG